MSRRMFSFLYSPPDSPTGGTPPPPSMGKEDIIDFLSSDDESEVIDLKDSKKDKKENKDDKQDKSDKSKKSDKETEDSDSDSDSDSDEDSDEDDELKELEDDLEDDEIDEEKLELVTPVRRREILKKYPELFKDFPYLEKAYYREQQYTELLPTIDDAKKAVEAIQTLNNFEKDVLEGNTKTILASVKSENPKSFNKIVDNYLKTIAEVDMNAYNHIITNVIKSAVINMANLGKKKNNEELTKAAQLLNEMAFGSDEITAPTNYSKDTTSDDEEHSKKESDLSRREEAFLKNKLSEAVEDLNTRVNNSYKSTIEAHIDPKDSMTEYVRKTAVKEAMASLETAINKDTRFKSLVDKLWKKAIEDNMNRDSVNRVRSAFLAKAKTLLPAVIKQARNEALKGMGKRVTNEDKEDRSDDRERKSEKRESRTPDKSATKYDKNDLKGKTTLEFLMED